MFRERARLSQHELAYRANINKNNISLYETGDRLPTLASMFAICKALRISPERFVREIRALDPDI